MNNEAIEAIESLRAFALTHGEVQFAHLCTAAINGEEWAMERMETALHLWDLYPVTLMPVTQLINAIRTTDTSLSRDNTVVVETMPDQHRASHRAAGNWGQYPSNGAVRERATAEEADEIVANDPDGYAWIAG